jgi:hypothetical protein
LVRGSLCDESDTIPGYGTNPSVHPVSTMASYRFRLLADGKSEYDADCDCRDDLEALGTAENLSADFELEVWRGERRLAHVRKGTVAIDVVLAR